MERVARTGAEAVTHVTSEVRFLPSPREFRARFRSERSIVRKHYMPPNDGESERDWVARNLYWVSRDCAETHELPCQACTARKEFARSGLSAEPGTALKFLNQLWGSLASKGRTGEERQDAFPRGKRSKASVYILMGADGEVLYVGKSKNVRFRIWNRSNGHAATKPWFSEVTSVMVFDYETEGDAFDAEARNIFDLAPKYNISIPEVPVRTPKWVDQWIYESPEEVRA